MTRKDGTWVCTGRGAGRLVRCPFRTRSAAAAMRHFETKDHDVVLSRGRRAKSAQISRRHARLRTQNPCHAPNPGGRILIYPHGRLRGTWFGKHAMGGWYKHQFNHRDASIYGNPDGSITIKLNSRGRLWNNYDVP